ncbi:hypothetical protein Scep_016494 [Stephania cephalantha]|uniref:Uncharacterized protein n=1 Tax=Stephania cephalantha TaxID=152367 RepID=A0AAP0IMT3_9MAGN
MGPARSGNEAPGSGRGPTQIKKKKIKIKREKEKKKNERKLWKKDSRKIGKNWEKLYFDKINRN